MNIDKSSAELKALADALAQWTRGFAGALDVMKRVQLASDRVVKQIERAALGFAGVLDRVKRASPALDRYKAARKLSEDDPRRIAWEKLGSDYTPAELVQLLPALGTIPLQQRGRPSGSKVLEALKGDSEMMAALQEAERKGIDLRPVARKILSNRGLIRGQQQLRGAADYRVKLFKRSSGIK